ncbi:hypothetical protein GCM10027589_46010 [Actinocorallia lasiicapitis]
MSRHRAPRPRRFHRLGRTSLAVSAGVLLVFGAAAPAVALPRADKPKKTCPKGTDPVTTWNNIVCQAENNAEDFKKKIDDLTKDKDPDPGPQKIPDTGPDGAGPGKKKPKPKPKPRTVSAPSTPRVSLNSTVPLTTPASFTKLPETATALPRTPQVAGSPQTAAQAVALPEVHLMPVSAVTSTGDARTAVWAAIGSGAITGVVMLQFSVLGARLRRRA